MRGRRDRSERYLTSVLFTDIVGSTQHAAELGDAAWRDLVQVHHSVVRKALRAFGGREVDTAGDGFFATFDAPAGAVDCGLTVSREVRNLGIQLRAGVHVGEVEEIAGKVGGISVPIASRIMSAAAPGEVLVSATVRDLAAGSRIRFQPRGRKRLKGIAGTWELFVASRPEEASAAVLDAAEAATRRAAAVRRAGERPIWERRPRAVAAAAALAGAALLLAVLAVLRPWQEPALPGIDPNSVGVVDLGRMEIVAQLGVGERPAGIAHGEGAIWVSSATDATVSKIDPVTRQVVDIIEVGRDPAGIALGDGAVWVANSGERSVSRIDAATGRVVDTISVGNGPLALIFVGGSIWVAEASDSTVSEVDPSSGLVRRTVPVPARPSALIAEGSGVWVLSEDAATLTHIDRASGVTSQAPIQLGGRPTAIAYAGGALWVADADGSVARVDPVGNRVTAVVEVAGTPTALAASEDGLWVATAQGTVHGLGMEATPRVTGSIASRSAGEALVVVDRELWVASHVATGERRGGTLRVLTAGEALNLDPIDFFASQIVALQADGLVGYRRAGGVAGSTLLPALASSIPTPTDGGLTYTFQLRPGLVYSEGTTVVASDFRRGIERSFRLGDPFFGEVVGPVYYGGIVGAATCIETPTQCELSAGVEVDDSAGTITFRLAEPDPDFLHRLALPFAVPAPPSVPMDEHITGPYPGTGPYTVSEVAESGIVLERNPNFRVWDAQVRPDGYPDRIELIVENDLARQVELVSTAQADAMAVFPAQRIPTELLSPLRAQYPTQLHFGSVSTLFAFMNTEIAPFDSPEVRQAVNLAVDRERLADEFGGPGAASPTCQVVPPGWPGYRPYCPYTAEPDAGGQWHGPDLDAARRLVAASGTEGMSITVGPIVERYAAIAEELVRVLEELGYETTLDPVRDDESVFAALMEGRIEIGALQWNADLLAPSGFLSGFTCAQSHEVPRVCDPAIDAMVADALALQTADPAAANAAWSEVDRAVVDLAVWAPLLNAGSRFVSDRVGNYQFHPAYGVLLDQLWIED